MKTEEELKKNYWSSAEATTEMNCSRQNLIKVAKSHGIKIYKAAPNYFYYSKKGVASYVKKR